MKKRLIVTPDRCIGCRSCEIACSFVHTEVNIRPAMSRVRVYPMSEKLFVPVLCLQCAEAACVKVCPTKTLVRNPQTLAIEVKSERCIHCKSCASACPFGNIHFDEGADKIIKCDVCEGNPACARFCPSGALEWASEPSKNRQIKMAPSPLVIASLAKRS